jgi:hypothetical protein
MAVGARDFSPGHEADHSFLSGTEVRNTWNYTSIPHPSSLCGVQLNTGYAFMMWYLVKHRDYFSFVLVHILLCSMPIRNEVHCGVLHCLHQLFF